MMSRTLTPSEIAQGLGDAFASRDLSRLARLLHPHVRWGGDDETDETCHGPEAVVDCYAALLSSGVTAEVDELVICGQRIMLRLLVDGLDESSDAMPHYQVFRVADGRIHDIRGSSDRKEAQRLLG